MAIRAIRLLVAGLVLDAVGLLGLPTPARAQQGCPPPPPPGLTVTPVPNKPGEQGYLLSNSERDRAGDRVELWCLAPVPGVHGGWDFAQRYISANGTTDVWIGACVFACGANRPDKRLLTQQADPAVPAAFLDVSWHNMEPYPNGTNDWDFNYDPETNRLCVTKTRGHWVRPLLFGTATYETTEDLGTDCYAAPPQFKDLHWMDTPLTQASPPPGCTNCTASETFSPLGAVSPGERWTYALRVNSLGGSGTEDDPYLGLDTVLRAGDVFTIGGAGIRDPFVTSLAALPAYGGWVVDAFGAGFVTFRATADASLLPATNITGFGFTSAGVPGEVPWLVASRDPLLGSSGTVIGPTAVPEPSTLVLLGGTLAGLWPLGCRVRTRRRRRPPVPCA